MRTGQPQELPARLEGVRRRFERWRQTHRARARIPDSLWARAVAMAGAYGINRTAKALRVGYYALKERVEEKAAAARDVPEGGAAATFLEVAPAADHGRSAPTMQAWCPVGARTVPAGGCECTLELEDAAGAKMRVHLKGAQAPDLAALSRSFWNPTP